MDKDLQHNKDNNNRKDPLEEFFQKELEAFRANPSDDMWERIAPVIPPKPSNGFLRFMNTNKHWLSLAATLLLFCVLASAGYYIYQNQFLALNNEIKKQQESIDSLQGKVDDLNKQLGVSSEKSAVSSGKLAVGSGQLAVGSGQSEVGSGQLAVGSGKSTVGSGQSEVSSGQLAVGSGQSAVSSGKSAVGSGKSAVGSGQLAVGSGQLAVGSGQLAVGSGQSEVGSGQLAVGSGQLAVGSGKWEVGSRQSSIGNRHPVTGNEQLVTSNRQLVTGIEQQVTGNRHQATGNGQQTTGIEHQATGNGHQATGNGQPATDPISVIANTGVPEEKKKLDKPIAKKQMVSVVSQKKIKTPSFSSADNKFGLSISVLPLYNYRSIKEKKNPPPPPMNHPNKKKLNEQETGRITFNTGIGLKYRLNQNFYIQSGLEYGKNRHRIVHHTHLTYTEQNGQQDEQGNVSAKYDYTLNTSYGDWDLDMHLTKPKTQPGSPHHIKEGDKLDIKVEGELKITRLRVPLVLGFQSNTQAIRFGLAAGINANFLIDKQSQITHIKVPKGIRHDLTNVQLKEKDIPAITYDYQISLPLSYTINPSLSWNIEPVFRRNIKAIHQNDRLKTHHFAAGISTGLCLSF